MSEDGCKLVPPHGGRCLDAQVACACALFAVEFQESAHLNLAATAVTVMAKKALRCRLRLSKKDVNKPRFLADISHEALKAVSTFVSLAEKARTSKNRELCNWVKSL